MEKKDPPVEKKESEKQLEFLNEMKDEIISAVKDSIKNPSAKYLTIEEAGKILKVSRSTITRMIRNGDLIAKKAYKRVLIPEKSIEKLLITINR